MNRLHAPARPSSLPLSLSLLLSLALFLTLALALPSCASSGGGADATAEDTTATDTAVDAAVDAAADAAAEAALADAADDATADSAAPAWTLRKVGGHPPPSPAGEAVTVTAEAVDADGNAVAGVPITLLIVRGGGSVEPASAVTGEDGRVTVAWTLGAAPVKNILRFLDGASALDFVTRAVVDAPLAPAPFGDVNAFLTAEGIEGSTEDLAFLGDRLVLGVPGGLVALDPKGVATRLTLSGDPLDLPLGIATDGPGNLWVADANGKALRRVSPDGVVTTVLGPSSAVKPVYPNFVTVGPSDLVYLSDTCLGAILVVDPADGAVKATLAFDAALEGGPNGLAFDPASGDLFATTEGTALLCLDGTDATSSVAGLFRYPLDADGLPGARATVAAGVASYGDGMTFDADGNLYVVFDFLDGFALVQSALMVLPHDGDTLLPFLATTDRILANPAFGSDAFGRTRLYIARIAIPVVSDPSTRGVDVFDVGIVGASNGPDVP